MYTREPARGMDSALLGTIPRESPLPEPASARGVPTPWTATNILIVDFRPRGRTCSLFLAIFRWTDLEKKTPVAPLTLLRSMRRYLTSLDNKNVSISTGDANREDLESLWAFKDKLKELGHFYTEYDSTEHLKRQFKDQLEKLQDDGRL